MSDKFKGKKHLNRNPQRREKFLKPLITDEDFKDDNDVFLGVVKNRPKQNIKKVIPKYQEKRGSYYLSPIRGKVEDRSSFPVTSSKGKIDKQYDFLRPTKKMKEEELKKQYGTEYYEFSFANRKRENIKQHMQKDDLKENLNKNRDQFNLNKNLMNSILNSRNEEPQSSSYFEENKINIIYEEEIDLDGDKNVVTSYDEDNKMTFFSDYEKSEDVNKDVNKYYSNVEVYEHHEDPKLRAELKRLFSEYDEEDKKKVYFKEDIEEEDIPQTKVKPKTFQREHSPIKQSQPKKQTYEKNHFVNLKEEIDKKYKKETEKSVKKENVNDLEQYKFPPFDLLSDSSQFMSDQTDWIESQIERLDATLESFGIAAKTVHYTQGPSVTRFEVEPEPGTKVSRITNLQDDIKLRLAASDIRIEAPISGKSTVGVEVPNKEIRMVRLREILESNTYKTCKTPLKIALGLDISGDPIYSDIGSMTHSLIAGSTGSGKSVCINTIIISLLYHAMPDEVKMVLIDPKKVEFSMYKDIPHLLTPVINDPKTATLSLKWLTEEMDRRYQLIESVGARDIKTYNVKRNRSPESLPKLPYIVVIIDELADLMMVAAAEVEEYIQRISQLARAAGIHLIIATQRPSTNVITGTIKTNIPTRISFKVSSAIDSRIILDDNGAEKLLGRGDMLLLDNSNPHLRRLQGSYISDEEIEKVTEFVKNQLAPDYEFTDEDLTKTDTDVSIDYEDDKFDEACRFVIELGEASASRLQRQFSIGYNRAARMIEMMENYNIVGPQQGGNKPREVLMTIEEYERMIYS